MPRYIYQSHFVDGNGSVVTNGTVNVYLTGTSTVATIYAASSGGSAISGGQIATSTSDGSFSFWVDTGDYAIEQLFRIVLSGSKYNTRTYDDIKIYPNDVDAADYTELKAFAAASAGTVRSVSYRSTIGDGGGGEFYFLSGDQSANAGVVADTYEGVYVKPTSPGDGSTGVWVRQATNDDIYLSWFGVDASDTVSSETDNDLRIQAVVDANYGKTIILPHGVVRFKHIDIVYPIHIKGATGFSPAVHSGNPFDFVGSYLRHMDTVNPGLDIVTDTVILEDFSMVGNADTPYAATNADLIEIKGDGGYHDLRNLFLTRSGANAITLTGHVSIVNITGGMISYCVGAGIYGRHESSAQINAINIKDVNINRNGIGIDVWGGSVTNILDNTIQGNLGEGVRLYADDMSTKSSSTSGTTISGNYFELNAGGSIRGFVNFSAAGPVVHYIQNLAIHDNYLLANSATSDGDVTAHIQFEQSGTGSGQMNNIKIGKNTYAGNLPHVDMGGMYNYDSELYAVYSAGYTITDKYINLYNSAIDAYLPFSNTYYTRSSAPPVGLPTYVGQVHNDRSAKTIYISQWTNSLNFAWVVAGSTPLSGSGAPASTPLFIGQEYLDTAASKWYKAKATSSSADWLILN